MSNEQESELDELGNFLEDHYEKFAIMGIFGTITVFLSSNWLGGSDSLVPRVGIIASLSIFALSALWIAMKCYEKLRASSGHWPRIPEFGYAVIFVGTLALGGAVVSASQVYTATSQLLGEFVLTIMLALVYSRVYPGDLDLPSQEEEPRFETLSTFSMLGGVFIVVFVYASTLRAWARGIFGLDFVLFVPLAVMFGFVFFAIRESLIGVVQIFQGEMNDLRKRIFGVWKVRTSLAISVLAVVVVTFYTRDVAKTAVDPNIGYYRVLGMPSSDFTLAHWLGTAAIFSFFVLFEQRLGDSSRLLGRIAQVIAILTALLIIVEVIWFVPNGTHVIPI